MHSSAGIGRTDAFIFVLRCLDHLAFNYKFETFTVLIDMRRDQIEIFITTLGIIEAQLGAPLNYYHIAVVFERFQGAFKWAYRLFETVAVWTRMIVIKVPSRQRVGLVFTRHCMLFVDSVNL